MLTGDGTTATTIEAKALLEAANQASAQVSVLHIAFMAVCAYVLVIVFSTTDLDLLIGKGVKLPVVDVEVPIVGFYGSAPLLIVLVHFNLLLQLQLLSRKLYAYDAAASATYIPSVRPDAGGVGGERDMLHIFPYTYYLVGHTSLVVRHCLGAVVGITMLLLPLVTLLLLQLRFLAYQEASITWAQRIGVWTDAAIVVALWPIIMDRNDNWINYLCELLNWVHKHTFQAAFFISLWMFVVALLFAGDTVSFPGAFLIPAGIAVLDVFLAALLPLIQRWYLRDLALRGVRRRSAFTKVRGMPGFLLVLALGLPMPLALVTKGEWLETGLIGETGFIRALDVFRRLDLTGEVLLAKPATPEIVAQLRDATAGKAKEALAKVAPIKLQGRGLRGALLGLAILSGSDLRDAHLEGAMLIRAHMEGADLRGAHLENALLGMAYLEGANLHGALHMEGATLVLADLKDVDLGEAHLEGADLQAAHLEGAILMDAHLEGANLAGAHLEGAMLDGTWLESANLRDAHLEGAGLMRARLAGSNLSGARMEGAMFFHTDLQGADLRNTRLYTAYLTDSRTSLVDMRGATWKPLTPEELERLQALTATIPNKIHHYAVHRRLEKAATPGLPPPAFDSCLTDAGAGAASVFPCKKQWLPDELSSFKKALYGELEKLACETTPMARSLIFSGRDRADAKLGFKSHMAALMGRSQCKGLQGLQTDEKDALLDAKKQGPARSGP